MRENKVENIRRMIIKRFDVKSNVDGNYIKIGNINVKGNTYECFEDYIVKIVDAVTSRYDVHCDYEAVKVDGGYEFLLYIMN